MDIIDYEVKIFKALAHPIRLEIIKKLIAEEACVCELQDCTKFSQSNLSQHLNILKGAGLVKTEKKGLFTYYSLSNNRVKEIVNLVESLNKDNLKELLGEE